MCSMAQDSARGDGAGKFRERTSLALFSLSTCWRARTATQSAMGREAAGADRLCDDTEEKGAAPLEDEPMKEREKRGKRTIERKKDQPGKEKKKAKSKACQWVATGRPIPRMTLAFEKKGRNRGDPNKFRALPGYLAKFSLLPFFIRWFDATEKKNSTSGLLEGSSAHEEEILETWPNKEGRRCISMGQKWREKMRL